MRKIISLFQRNYDTDRFVRDEIVPGAEWVVASEGVATVKWDGTACLMRDGKLYKRYDAKKGRTTPAGWEPCEDAPDPNTGHWPGWLPVGEGPEDAAYREGLASAMDTRDWTYELVGPKVQGNPYHLLRHDLWRHGSLAAGRIGEPMPPRVFAALREWFINNPFVEGIVWWRDIHNVDCDKVKIKWRDFGLPWPLEVSR